MTQGFDCEALKPAIPTNVSFVYTDAKTSFPFDDNEYGLVHIGVDMREVN